MGDFAPGPWSFEGPLQPGNQYRIRSDRGLVTYVGDPVTISYDRANARLIAAAPDGLAIAKKMLSYAQSGAWFGYPPGAVDELIAFIDKAEGRTLRAAATGSAGE